MRKPRHDRWEFTWRGPREQTGPAGAWADERQGLLHVLAAATFLIFFQAFMIAPLLPALAKILLDQADHRGLRRAGLPHPLRRDDTGLAPCRTGWGAG